MEVTEGRILELENLLDFQNAKIGKLEYRIERLERLVAVLMEANKITGGETNRISGLRSPNSDADSGPAPRPSVS